VKGKAPQWVRSCSGSRSYGLFSPGHR
jgi:hypothetical protein